MSILFAVIVTMEANKKNKGGDENDFMISTNILKPIVFLFHKFISSSSPKLYGVNIYKLLAKTYFMYNLILPVMMIFNLYYCSTTNLNESVNYLLILIAFTSGTFKVCCVWKNFDKIWNCIQLTSVKHLTYKHYCKKTLHTGRKLTKLFSLLFVGLWVVSVGTWILSPFIVQNYFIHIKIGTLHDYYYRYNILNYIYPVTDVFYNEHFIAYYILELSNTHLVVHGSMVFDVLVISFCITIRYQLKTISISYRTITDANNYYSKGTYVLSKIRVIMIVSQIVLHHK